MYGFVFMENGQKIAYALDSLYIFSNGYRNTYIVLFISNIRRDNIMYFYHIVWGYFEIGWELILMHEKEFKKDEFKKIADEAVKYAFEQMIKRPVEEFEYADLQNAKSFILEYLKRQGFKEVLFTAVQGYHGMFWCDDVFIEDEFVVRHPLRELLGDELYKKAIDYNLKVKKAIGRWWKK